MSNPDLVDISTIRGARPRGGMQWFTDATEYPRMMYKAGGDELHHDLPCTTAVAATADEAEAMSAEGWDISPRAAHGLSDGMAAATTAKDDEIAMLRAQVEALTAPPIEDGKRGTGRPRSAPE